MGMLAFCRDPSALGAPGVALLLVAPFLLLDDTPEPRASFRNWSLFIVAVGV